jgi:hypothetical protein
MAPEGVERCITPDHSTVFFEIYLGITDLGEYIGVSLSRIRRQCSWLALLTAEAGGETE